MNIPAYYLLPQDMVLVLDKQTGVVSTWHAQDAGHAIDVSPELYELVEPPRPPLLSPDYRPHPLEATYAAAAERPTPPPIPDAGQVVDMRADGERGIVDENEARRDVAKREADEKGDGSKPKADKTNGFNPADNPQSFRERDAATKGPLDK